MLRSKAFVSTEEMGDNYCLIGPYKQHWAHQEVELGDFPQENLLHVAVNRLREQGINVRQKCLHSLRIFSVEIITKILSSVGPNWQMACGWKSSNYFTRHWELCHEAEGVEAGVVGKDRDQHSTYRC